MGVKKRSTRIIEWIEGTGKQPGAFGGLRIPEGRDVGKRVRLRKWQRNDIKKVYDNPHGTRRAIISYGRKNSKTTTAAFLTLVHLCGPEAVENSQLYSAAQSRDQAAILFNLAVKMVRMSPELSEYVIIRETNKQLYCEALGTIYRALSADATTAYGLSPVFTVHDELGQVRGPRSELYEALETATGAHENPLSIIISTQAPTDNDLLSRLIDDALGGHDERVVVSLYTAPKEDDPFSEETVRLANPAFGDFQNAREVMDMAAAASRMPSREAEYRNLILNQRVEAENPLIPISVWQSNGADPESWGVTYGGLDLSETNDLTAFILVSPVNGLFGVRSTFWLPEEGLVDRSRKDSVPYDVWHEQGFLRTTPGKSIEYEYVAHQIAEAFHTTDLRKVAFDRYNMRHLRPWLIKAGLSEGFVDERFVEFGQGFVSMSPAIRIMESMLLNDKLRHSMHPVLSMCAANAIARMDEAGNRKMDKKRSTGRIDGLIGLCMALSLASEDMNEAPVYPVKLEEILEA